MSARKHSTTQTRRFLFRLLVFAGGILPLLVGEVDSAKAQQVTFEFSGNVLAVSTFDGGAGLDGSISVGSPVTGRYTFDAGVPPLPGATATHAEYLGVLFTLTVGNYTFLTSDYLIEVSDNDLVAIFPPFGIDKYRLTQVGPASLTNGTDTFGVGWLWPWTNFDTTAFSSVALPASPPELSKFSGQLTIRVGPPSGPRNIINIRATSLTLAPSILSVEIDIKPGSDPNSINLGSNGVIPVAILSSPEFDATQVDPETVTLAGSGVAVKGKGNKLLASVEDVNNDGLNDLVLKIETQNLDPGQFQDGFAVLIGETFGGQAIEGSDAIAIVPPE